MGAHAGGGGGGSQTLEDVLIASGGASGGAFADAENIGISNAAGLVIGTTDSGNYIDIEGYAASASVDSTIQWQIGSDRVYTRGTVRFAGSNPPIDDFIDVGECILYFDSTHGAAKLKIRAKDAGGTIVNGSVDLTP